MIDKQKLLDLGGNEWSSPDGRIRRIYFSEQAVWKLFGLHLSFYKTGNISAASLNDERISHSHGGRLRNKLAGKFYYDLNTQKFRYREMDGKMFYIIVNK